MKPTTINMVKIVTTWLPSSTRLTTARQVIEGEEETKDKEDRNQTKSTGWTLPKDIPVSKGRLNKPARRTALVPEPPHPNRKLHETQSAYAQNLAEHELRGLYLAITSMIRELFFGDTGSNHIAVHNETQDREDHEQANTAEEVKSPPSSNHRRQSAEPADQRRQTA